MRDSTKAEWENILHTLCGFDGCVRLVMLRAGLEELDKQAEAGSETAYKLIAVMRRFSKLIDVLVPGRLT